MEQKLEESAVKSVANRFLTAISAGHYLETIDEIVDDNCIIHSLFGNLHGRLAMQRVVHAWVSGFPDLKIAQNLSISEGDLVTVLWEAKATHKGEFRGAKPTGKRVCYSGVSICRVQRNKITEYWSYLDYQYLSNQLK